MLAAKINLSPIDQGLTFQFGHLFAHPIQQTPVVKLGKTRVSPFNGAHLSASFGKSADPTCYNVCVGGNHAAALFDIARRMKMEITISKAWWSLSLPFRGEDGRTLSHKERHVLADQVEKKFPKYYREKFKTAAEGAARADEITAATGINMMALETCAMDF